ncbi:MAG: 3-keto-5-aminohexanoate cleavage protein [Acetobacteraceae bacterium]|nr:3-keto-5-aminohexanoate cleavage protein [Acetobacteraceae bacterium]
MTRPVIISCALTGGADSAHMNPAIPVTPEQIASEALAARKAGAAIVHIHVRDPKTGKPSRDVALYRETVHRIRDAGTDVIINLTTGPGARFVPDDTDPTRGGEGTAMATPQERVAHVLELRPEICSLDIATMNFGAHAMVNIPRHIEIMAKMISDAGVKPELEVFDLGHVVLASRMVERGLFGAPPFLQLCLGIPGGAPATTEAMLVMRNALPPGANWSAFGISRHQFPMVAQSFVLGGQVRVGLEDNLYISRGVLASGNAQLVERAVAIIENVGASVATPDQARSILGLTGAAGRAQAEPEIIAA